MVQFSRFADGTPGHTNFRDYSANRNYNNNKYMNYRFRTITYLSMLSNFAASRTRCGLLVSLPFLHTFLCALSCLLSSCLLLPCLPTLHLSSCCLLLGNILSYLLACLASSCLVFFWLHLSSFVLNLGDWFFLE